jgi:two-component system response regulator AtoC
MHELRARRVLVAEDDRDMRRLLAAVLRREGYRVLEASDGTEVLDRVESTIWSERRDLIGVIVSDVNMPGLNGLELLEALHAKEIDTPVIFVTAFGSDGTVAQASWLGAAAVLEKPIDFDTLRGEVAKALYGPSAPRPGFASTARAPD